jgi:hypothetical protein
MDTDSQDTANQQPGSGVATPAAALTTLAAAQAPSAVAATTNGGHEDDHALEFLAHLREEKLHHKEKRAAFTLQKLAFITGLFGIAAFELGQMRGVSADLFIWILYLIPVIGISYDVFIYAEDFKVKRVGTFIRDYQPPDHPECISACEKAWENGLQGGGLREPFAPWATLALTVATATAAALVLASVKNELNYHEFLPFWIVVGLVFPIAQYIYCRRVIRGKMRSQDPKTPSPLGDQNKPSASSSLVRTGQVNQGK